MLERNSSKGNKRLAERRRSRGRRLAIGFCVLFVLVIAALVWGMQSTKVRVASITMYGADQSLADVARAQMQGKYLGIIPRDSIFFVPESAIRHAILDAQPEIAAISIFGDGLTSISIKVDERAPVGRWCGLSKTPGVPEYCYFFDANGYLFGATDDATTTTALNPFILYAPLAASSTDPLRSTLPNAASIPSAFDFARQVNNLGATVVSIAISGDEVTDTLLSGTYLTYVLGDEQNAFAALMSSKPDVNLTDGSLQYVDLRFPGKVYAKPKTVSHQ